MSRKKCKVLVLYRIIYSDSRGGTRSPRPPMPVVFQWTYWSRLSKGLTVILLSAISLLEKNCLLLLAPLEWYVLLQELLEWFEEFCQYWMNPWIEETLPKKLFKYLTLLGGSISRVALALVGSKLMPFLRTVNPKNFLKETLNGHFKGFILRLFCL